MKKIPTILLIALCAIANCQENLYNINDMDLFYSTQNRGSIENVSNSYAACFEMTNTNPDAFIGLRMKSGLPDFDFSNKDNLYFKFDIRVIPHTSTMPNNADLEIVLFNKPDNSNGPNGERVSVKLLENNYYNNWNSNWRTVEVPLSALTDERPNNGVAFDWSAVNNFRIRHTWDPQNNSAPQFGFTLCIRDVTVSNESILPANSNPQTIVIYKEGIAGPHLTPYHGEGGSEDFSKNYNSFNNPAGESVLCVETVNFGPFGFTGFRVNTESDDKNDNKLIYPDIDLSNKDNLYFRFDIRVNHSGTMPNGADLQVMLFNRVIPDDYNTQPNGESVSVKLIDSNYYNWNSNWTTVEVPLSALTDEKPGNGVAFNWSLVNNIRIRHVWSPKTIPSPPNLTIGIDNVVITDTPTLPVNGNGNAQITTIYDDQINTNMIKFEGTGGSGHINYESANNPANGSAACVQMRNTGFYAFTGFKIKDGRQDLDLSDIDNLSFKFDVRVNHDGTMPNNADLQVLLFNNPTSNNPQGESVYVKLIDSNYYNWNSNWTTVEVPLSALIDEKPGNGIAFNWSAVNNIRIRHIWSPKTTPAPNNLTIGIDNVVISNKSILPDDNFNEKPNTQTTTIIYNEQINANMMKFEGTGGSGHINYESANNPANGSAACVEMRNTGFYAFTGFKMKDGRQDLDLSDTNNLSFKFDVRVNHSGTMPNNADLQVLFFNNPTSNNPKGESVYVKLIDSNYYNWNSNWTTVEVPLSALIDENPSNGIAFNWSAVNNIRIRHIWRPKTTPAPNNLTIGIDNVVIINDATTLNVDNFNDNTNNFTINSPITRGENIHITGKNIKTIDIYNITGQYIDSKRINGLSSAYLNSSQMASGLYFAIINKSHSKKFIVK